MQGIKEQRPDAGVIRKTGVRNTVINSDLNKILNNFDSNTINNAINNLNKTIDPRGMDKKQLTNMVKTNILPYYMPSRKVFEDSLEGLTDKQKWHKMVLYNSVEEDMLNHLTDVINISTKIKGGTVSLDSNGSMVVRVNDKVTV